MADEYVGYLEDTSEDAEHYGTPRHSGRYPWGSGKNPQRNKNFLTRARDLQKQGLNSTQIAKAFNMSTTQYRALYSIAKDEEKAYLQRECQKLAAKGMSKVAIGKRLGLPDTTVGNYLKPEWQAKTNATRNIADLLKEHAESKPYLDVGKGVNRQLNVTETQFKTALEMLKDEGYSVVGFQVEQQTNPGNYTEIKVLTKNPKGLSEKELAKEVREHQTQITSPEGSYFEDYGETRRDISPPVSLDSKRVAVRYAEDGGTDKDGVIEIRKGVPDLALGQNRYAQVRIAVDDTHYLKGMAMYSDAKDWPDGVDIMFNTNKSKDTPKIGPDNDHSVLKLIKMKDGEYKTPENPFGAVTRDHEYYDENGVKHKSPLNIVNDDTDWDKWSKNLSSQFLSKQPVLTARQQLNLTYKQKEEEFKELCELTNPTIKRKLLESFAEDCDSASVHLKAAAFPRQATHVILPISSLKDTEVYAPNYKQGEEVVLIRYPHAGIFEIPRLKVNNLNKEGKSLLGNAEHAIGINSKVAEQLSGADFDGDTVVVIPTERQKIKSDKRLKELKDFDPKHDYPAYPGMKRVGEGDGFHKQQKMGDVSNLITDMTIQGASMDEIARAVKHSMVIIDAQKHNLNWKLSAQDNNIAELKEKYQGGKNRGASTLISKAKGDARIPEFKEKRVSDMTDDEKKRYLNGEKIYEFTDRKYQDYKKDPDGNYIPKNGLTDALKKTTKMEAAYIQGDDAYSLSSGKPIENVYAAHADRLRALANAARKEMLATGRLKQNPSARETYAQEVKELKAALNIALKNAPYERQAQLITQAIMREKIKANPDWEKDDIKRQKAVTLERARDAVGTRSRKHIGIQITPRQWEAIQAGAISDNILSEILKYTDTSVIQKYATPRRTKTFSTGMKARARSLLNMGYTQAQVAEELGVSVSTINKELG